MVGELVSVYAAETSSSCVNKCLEYIYFFSYSGLNVGLQVALMGLRNKQINK